MQSSLVSLMCCLALAIGPVAAQPKWWLRQYTDDNCQSAPRTTQRFNPATRLHDATLGDGDQCHAISSSPKVHSVKVEQEDGERFSPGCRLFFYKQGSDCTSDGSLRGNAVYRLGAVSPGECQSFSPSSSGSGNSGDDDGGGGGGGGGGVVVLRKGVHVLRLGARFEGLTYHMHCPPSYDAAVAPGEDDQLPAYPPPDDDAMILSSGREGT